MWSDPLLLAAFERFPPRATIFKASPGRPEEEFELEATRPFHHWFGLAADELFGGRDVLDLGSGFGGSAVWFERYGARSVVGVEVEEDKVSLAAEFASRVGAENVAFALGRGEALPFAADSFDLITMYDVLEHVVSPRATFDECWRVLRPGGLLATVFPPYYDVLGGSHLHGYATRVPGLNLVFTTRQLRSACEKLLRRQGVDYERYLRSEPTDKLWNQNGLTVKGCLRMIAATDFRIQQVRLLGHRDLRVRYEAHRGRRACYQLLAWAAQVPYLREAFCSRVCALLEKAAASDDSRVASAPAANEANTNARMDLLRS
jgi:SAM-dependent methyltransferase